jgi:hypothetical protein
MQLKIVPGVQAPQSYVDLHPAPLEVIGIEVHHDQEDVLTGPSMLAIGE